MLRPIRCSPFAIVPSGICGTQSPKHPRPQVGRYFFGYRDYNRFIWFAVKFNEFPRQSMGIGIFYQLKCMVEIPNLFFSRGLRMCFINVFISFHGSFLIKHVLFVHPQTGGEEGCSTTTYHLLQGFLNFNWTD